MKRLLTVLAIVVAAGALGGCSRLQAAFTPPPKVVTEAATVAVAGAPVKGELHKGVPADTPLWPNATVQDSTYLKSTATFTLTTTDPYDDVLSGVAVGFERAKWEVAEEDTSAEDIRSTLVTASKPGREALVSIADLGDGTVVMEYSVQVVK